MERRPASKDGLRNGVQLYAVTHFPRLWKLLRALPVLRSATNRLIINQMVFKMRPRPGRLSTMAEYTSWDSLTDRRYSARHLPPRPASDGELPPLEDVVALFRRNPAVRTASRKSTLLFPHFAQWFVDGFLRTDPDDPRKNTSTHDIDLSQLYGQDVRTADILRSHEGGRLKSQIINGEEYPPYYFGDDGTVKPEFADLPITFPGGAPERDRKGVDAETLPDDQRRSLFATAVPRGNIHYGFTMVNTLFLREHNRVAGELAAAHPGWDDERLFETARNVLILILIKIVVEDYINHITPFHFRLMAESGIGVKQPWYRQNWMSVEFNLLYRWHSLIPDTVTIGGTARPMSEARWDTRLVTDHGLAKLFAEASEQPAFDIGILNTPEFLLEVERASLEIGRATQLRSYNEYRVACGFPRVTKFADISSAPEVQAALQDVYGTPDRIELFAGLFAEDVRPGAALPTLMGSMVAVDAFSQALTNPLLAPGIFGPESLSPEGLRILAGTTCLADVLRRNAPDGGGGFVGLTQRTWSHD